MKFTVIGITDAPQPFFPPEVLEIIAQGQVFSGGKRHHTIVEPFLPVGAQWIDITAPLDAVFEQYRGDVIVFASGDPLFFGFASTIRQRLPEAHIVLYPSFNSLQTLAHRLVMPYHDMRIISLTGRPWTELDRALIERTHKMGVLTDRTHTPATIAQRLLDYGYDSYTMHVGEHLGNPACERITSLSLDKASECSFDYPNCLILTSSHTRHRHYGIPDSAFALLNGREKMITKMPIRLLSLQAMELTRKTVMWDIGFCTGSVSIEARCQFPHLHIEAFEIRPEGEQLMTENCRRMGTPGIGIHIGDFLQTDIDVLPQPDAVFIGGHGGRLKEIMAKVYPRLAAGGCIVMNSVTSQVAHTASRQLWDEACAELDLQQQPSLHIVLNNFNPIEILKCIK